MSGSDPPGSKDTRIRVTAERLTLGPGVGTPSGERFALWASNSSRPAADGIYTRDAEGGALGRVTTTPRGRLQQPLAYSPDATRLLFYQANRDRRAGSLYVVHANGTDRIRLTPPWHDQLVLRPRLSRRLRSPRADRVCSLRARCGRPGREERRVRRKR